MTLSNYSLIYHGLDFLAYSHNPLEMSARNDGVYQGYAIYY